jgi:hypothetical protein
MEWAFAQIDDVLEERRLDEPSGVGRLVPPVGPLGAAVLLGVAGLSAGVVAFLGNG